MYIYIFHFLRHKVKQVKFEIREAAKTMNLLVVIQTFLKNDHTNKRSYFNNFCSIL